MIRFALIAGAAAFLGTAAAAGDTARGEAVYARCAACHDLTHDRVGPRHCGLVGRRAGTVPGFDYSPAMKKSGILWNAKALDRFLANPLAIVPGTTMTYAGIPDRGERTDLISFLATASRDSPKCLSGR